MSRNHVRNPSVDSYHSASMMRSKAPVASKIKTNHEGEEQLPNLQIILEEKNRMIDKLKKQIHNQRIQLEFYIKKEMNSPMMVEFAKSCLPELTDDNMTVALAMNKFYKELGMKSRIMDLYDKVCNVAGRTNCIIQTQEVILNEIITNLRQYMNPPEIRKFLGNFDINTNYIEIFNSLLDTTLCLKKSMSNFQNCCDKLINAEEKRNEIVEQVYSLPQEERTICNYLVNIQMEKHELETMVKHLSEKWKSIEPVVDEIDLIESNLKVLHHNFDGLREEDDTGMQLPKNISLSDKSIPDSCVTKMLEKVYSQAMTLLSLSRGQRDKYNKEIDQLKEENKKLREIIEYAEKKTPVTKNTGAELKDVEKLHGVIKKTISEARKLEKSKMEELKRKTQECEELKKKLSETLMQKAQLQRLIETDSSDPNEFFLEREVPKVVYKIQVGKHNSK